MNDKDIVNKIQIFTNIKDEEKIALIAQKAERKLFSLISFEEGQKETFKEDIEDVIVDLSIYLLNRLPRYGVESESVMGFTFSYSSFPSDIKDAINALSVKATGGTIKDYDAQLAVAFDGWSKWL